MPEATPVITATGKRKTAIARVRLKPGTGQILVNGRPMTEYFPREVLHMRIQNPFEVVGAEGEGEDATEGMAEEEEEGVTGQERVRSAAADAKVNSATTRPGLGANEPSVTPFSAT